MTTLLEKAGQSIQTLRTRSAEQLNRTLMKVIQQRTNTIIQNICRCGLVNESTIKIHCFEEVETSFLGEEPHVINSWIQAILHCWRHMRAGPWHFVNSSNRCAKNNERTGLQMPPTRPPERQQLTIRGVSTRPSEGSRPSRRGKLSVSETLTVISC